jgi:hypothetical protein
MPRRCASIRPRLVEGVAADVSRSDKQAVTDAELPEIPLLVKPAWPHEVVACVADLVN